MIAYVDSSVLLRFALNQENRLVEFEKITLGGSSRLLKTECLRTLDRQVSTGALSQEGMTDAAEYLFDAFERMEFVPLTESILERSGEPLGLNLGALDAIHLHSAIAWRWARKHLPVFLTHDIALAKAARLFGFQVLGA